MNKKSLLIIIFIAVVMAVIAVTVIKSKNSTWKQSRVDKGGDLLGGDINTVEQVKFIAKGKAVTLHKNENRWVVKESFDYPADFEKLKKLVQTLEETRAAQTINVGESQYGRLELNSPDSSDKTGIDLELLDKDGKVVSAVRFGKMHMQAGYGGRDFPDGRYLLNKKNKSVILVAEPFSDVNVDKSSWLDKEFIKIKDLKRAALVKGDQIFWAVGRKTKSDKLTLDALAEGEEADTAKLSALGTAFSWASFNEVADPALKPEDTGLDKPKVFKGYDFDEFCYEISIGKTVGSNVYVSVKVEYQGPEKREIVEGEKPEDAAKKDAEFTATRIENIKKADDMNKRFAGWVYLLPEYVVDKVNLQRSDLIKKKEVEKKAVTPPAPPASPAE